VRIALPVGAYQGDTDLPSYVLMLKPSVDAAAAESLMKSRLFMVTLSW
jgi:hypothetical protein